MIPEQVLQPRNLARRNTLPFFTAGVDQVELTAAARTIEEAVATDGGSSGRRRFRYEGEFYEAKATV